jgi:hypothetical protein
MMFYLFLNLLIQPLEAKTLAIPRQAAISKTSMTWETSVEALFLRACLKYAATADSSSFSVERFNDFCCLE